MKCFDKIHHSILLGLIGKRMQDPYTMDILKKLLRVGYIHFGDLSNSQLENKIGTPQGSILSPLMANIYLHELDQ